MIKSFDEFVQHVGGNGEGFIIAAIDGHQFHPETIKIYRQHGEMAAWALYCADIFIEEHKDLNSVFLFKEVILIYEEVYKDAKKRGALKELLLGRWNQILCDMNSWLAWGSDPHLAGRFKDHIKKPLAKRPYWKTDMSGFDDLQKVSIGNFLSYLAIDHCRAYSNSDIIAVNQFGKIWTHEFIPFFKSISGPTER